MYVAICIVMLAGLVYSFVVISNARKRVKGLTEHSEGLLRALKREREKTAALRAACSHYHFEFRAKDAELTKIKQDYEPSERLARKLGVARATGDQQDERLKHQNNEMRVMMNRLHRNLNFLCNALAFKNSSVPEQAKEAAKAAMREWEACNNWLSANKIEPYLGPVPGYDGQQAREREDFVTRGNGEIQPAGKLV